MSLASPAFDYESAVLACARGERYALRALYEREARWLLGVAQRIVRDRQLAEDVLHDAFLQVWQRAGSYQPALGSARGWIYTVVRHRALKEVRTPERMHAIDPQHATEIGDRTDDEADAGAATAFQNADLHPLHRLLRVGAGAGQHGEGGEEEGTTHEEFSG